MTNNDMADCSLEHPTPERTESWCCRLDFFEQQPCKRGIAKRPMTDSAARHEGEGRLSPKFSPALSKLIPLCPRELHVAVASVTVRASCHEAASARKATSVAGTAGTGTVVGGSRRTAVPAAAAAAAVVPSLGGVDGAAGAELSKYMPAVVIVSATSALLPAVRAVPGVFGVASATAVSAAVVASVVAASTTAARRRDPGVERSQLEGLGRV